MKQHPKDYLQCYINSLPIIIKNPIKDGEHHNSMFIMLSNVKDLISEISWEYLTVKNREVTIISSCKAENFDPISIEELIKESMALVFELLPDLKVKIRHNPILSKAALELGSTVNKTVFEIILTNF